MNNENQAAEIKKLALQYKNDRHVAEVDSLREEVRIRTESIAGWAEMNQRQADTIAAQAAEIGRLRAATIINDDDEMATSRRR